MASLALSGSLSKSSFPQVLPSLLTFLEVALISPALFHFLLPFHHGVAHQLAYSLFTVGWMAPLLAWSEFDVRSPGGLTLDQVVEVVCCSAASQGRSFLLDSPDSWMMECPLGPTLLVAALTGPHPFNATFCFCCIHTWHSRPLGDAVCEYPHQRPNQVKCGLCSGAHHPCIPVRVFPFCY